MANEEYKITAIHGVNRYIMDECEKAGLLARIKDNRNILWTPIQPTQDVGQFQDAALQADKNGSPWIVYNNSMDFNRQEFYMMGENGVYVIYSTSDENIRKTSNFIANLLRKYDVSAERVNDYIAASDLDGKYKSFHYQSISVSTFTSADPVPDDTTGRRLEAVITFKIQYSHPNSDS